MTGAFLAATATPRFTPRILILQSAREDFKISFPMPQKGITERGTAEMKFPPALPSSEPVIVRYRLPFGLNVAEPDSVGLCRCTKDGSGGERVGDILRFTTNWRGSTPGIFDVARNSRNWKGIVEALVSNDLAVTDEIVLVFERPTPTEA